MSSSKRSFVQGFDEFEFATCVDPGFDNTGTDTPNENANDKDTNIRGDVAMWRAVITQALQDAGSDSKKKEMRLIKAQATSWLSGYSEDFYTVCALADMDPDYVREQAKEAIARGCKWRNDVKPFSQDIKPSRKPLPAFETKSTAPANRPYVLRRIVG